MRLADVIATSVNGEFSKIVPTYCNHSGEQNGLDSLLLYAQLAVHMRVHMFCIENMTRLYTKPYS